MSCSRYEDVTLCGPFVNPEDFIRFNNLKQSINMNYDVFISCKSEDYYLGREVFEYLSNNRITAFMADKKLRQLGMSDYGRVIDDALENSKHLILVTSSIQNVMPDTSSYVYYEWHTFSEEKKSGRKKGNIVIIVTDQNMIGKLPIALRNNQTFLFDDFHNVTSYIIERYDEKNVILTKLGLSLEKSIKEKKESSQDVQLKITDKTDKRGMLFTDIDFFSSRMEYLERSWNQLIDDIINRKIVPVIGGEFLKVGKKTLNQFLLDEFTDAYDIKDKEIKSFSDLELSCQYRLCGVNIRRKLNSIWTQYEDSLIKSVNTDILERIFSLPYFPYIVTTNIDPVVERLLERIHGEKLKVFVYNGYPDIGREMRNINHLTPTLIYMYGKIGIHGNFVITNDDLRKFAKSWLSEYSCPKEFLCFFKTHTFLFLGYNYKGGIDELLWEDFTSLDTHHSTPIYIGDFIQNIEKGLEVCPDIIIDEIVTRLDKRTSELEKTYFDSPKQDMDIYLSCSPADSDIAEELYKSLTSLGKRVWYDKKHLDYTEDRCHAIESAGLFIPILSNNVKGMGVYCKEWWIALKHAAMFYPRDKVIPMVEKGFDYRNARIPDEFKNTPSIIFYSKDDDFDKLAKDLVDIEVKYV